MPFHSPEFFFLCLATFAVYYLGGARWQHTVLLLASLGFYYFAGLVDTILLLSVVSANYLLALLITRVEAKRAWTIFAVVVNLAVLAFFKYRRFGVEIFNHASGAQVALPALVIPLGISFYLFQLIAYQVDIARGLLLPERNYARMLLYILFFPHHQAGPIMRPAKFLPQFIGPKAFDLAGVGAGALWIVWGLAKKVMADNLALGVDDFYANLHGLESAAGAWLVAVKYSAQIYFDFSGYSDIAVGLGLLFGYHLDRNFDQPYLATNPSQFWQRWHITLSAWLRDYLYIPLGGNRKSPARTYVNLFLTMLLGGLWHGAAITFVLWGALHGLALVAHRRFPALFRRPAIGWLLTFAITVVAWVPFRAPTWTAMRHMLASLFHGMHAPTSAWIKVLLVAGALMAEQLVEDRICHTEAGRARAAALWLRTPALVRGAALAAVALLIVINLLDKTTYIYFRF